jgi:hypothetical protein
MNTKESKPWYKKWWVWLIIILVLVGAGSAAGNKSNTEHVTNSSSDKTTTAPSSKTEPAPKAEPVKEKMTIKNSTVTDKSYGIHQVDGEITNNDTGKHSATLKATFYSADGKIMGTASGAVNDVAPGETKTFSLMSTDSISGYKDMKVQVDTLL